MFFAEGKNTGSTTNRSWRIFAIGMKELFPRIGISNPRLNCTDFTCSFPGAFVNWNRSFQ